MYIVRVKWQRNNQKEIEKEEKFHGLGYFQNKGCLLQTIFVKGQIISECPYEIIVCPKISTKKFPRFLPWPLRRDQIKNFIKPIMLNNP